MARQVRELSRCWFETGQAIGEDLRPLAQAVCEAGTYGSMETRTRQRMERLREKHKNPVALLWAYGILPGGFRPRSHNSFIYF